MSVDKRLEVQGPRILILSAHADDHLRSAGTVFKLQYEKGAVPFEVVMTDSSLGGDYRSGKRLGRQETARARAAELTKASKYLGVRKTWETGEPDYGLIYRQDLVFGVGEIIREVKPELVIMPNGYDSHPDHKAANQIGIEAVRAASMNIQLNNEKYRLHGVEYKPYRVPEIVQVEMMQPDRVNLIVDVTEQLPQITRLFEIYDSQMSPRLKRYLLGLLQVRAYTLEDEKALAAEAFIIPDEFPSIAGRRENGLLL